MDPAARRIAPTWPQFLHSQAEAILACDFHSSSAFGAGRGRVIAVAVCFAPGQVAARRSRRPAAADEASGGREQPRPLGFQQRARR